MSKWRVRLGLLVLAVLVVSIPYRTSATNKEVKPKQVIRVGYYPLENFQEMDDTHHVRGYNIDYLTKLASYQNWEYVYVPYDSQQQAVQSLATGEIDLVGGLKYSDIEKQGVNGSEYMMGTTYITLLTLQSNEDLIYEDYEGFQGITVGYVNSNSDLQEFLNNLKENKTEVNVKPYDNSMQLHEALAAGEVQAILADFMEMDQEKERLLLRISPLSLFYGISKNNADFLTEFNQSMSKLWNEDYNFTDSLMDEYYSYYDEIPFTKEELEYIREAPEFLVGYSIYRAPVASYDSKSTKVVGIERDLVNEIAAQCGLKFKHVVMKVGNEETDTSALWKPWDEQPVNIVAGVAEGSGATTSWDGTQSRPYLECRKVVICQRGYEFAVNDTFRLGLIGDTTTLEREVNATFPKANLYYYKSLEECMEAVNQKQIDAALLNEYTVEKLIGKPRYDQLVTVPNVYIQENLTLAVLGNPEHEDILMSIINKSIRKIGTRQSEAIIIQHTVADPYKITGEDFMDKYYSTIVVIIAGALVFLFVNFSFSRKQRHVIQMLEQEQERYRLLMDNSDDILFDVGVTDGTCITFSKFLQRFGRDLPTQLERKDGLFLYGLEDVLQPDEKDRGTVHEMLELLVQDEPYVEQKIRLLTRDGKPLWYRLQMQLMREKGDNVRLLARLIDINQEMQENTQLRAISSRDALTGLMNKQSFMQNAKKQLIDSPLENCAIIFMDVDNFKKINDSFGHVEGDIFLKHVAREFKEIFREGDYVSRFGGDEMCAMVRNVTRKEIEMMAAQLLKTMGLYYVPPGFDLDPVPISVSIGIVMSPADGTELDELMRKADSALYYAKHQGKNQSIFYVEEMIENEDL